MAAASAHCARERGLSQGAGNVTNRKTTHRARCLFLPPDRRSQYGRLAAQRRRRGRAGALRLRPAGTLARNSSSHTVAGESLGARQSLRGDSEPPEPIFGPFGIAERLNWLVWKKRFRKIPSQWRDFVEVVGPAFLQRHGLRPGSAASITPGGRSEKGNFARAIAEAAHVIQMKILEIERADDGLRKIASVPAPLPGTSSGEIGVSKSAEHGRCFVAELARAMSQRIRCLINVSAPMR